MREAKDFITIDIDGPIQPANLGRQRCKLFKILMIGMAAVCIIGCVYFNNEIIRTNEEPNQRQISAEEIVTPRTAAVYFPIPDDDSLEDEWNQPQIFNPYQLQTDLPKAMTAPLVALEKCTQLPSHLPHDLLMQVHDWANDPEWFLSKEQKNVKNILKDQISDRLLNENDPTTNITLQIAYYPITHANIITSCASEWVGSSGKDFILQPQQMHCVNEILMQLFVKENVTITQRIGRRYNHFIYKVGGENYFDTYDPVNSCEAQRATAGRKLRRDQTLLEENKQEDLQHVEPVTNEESDCACVVL